MVRAVLALTVLAMPVAVFAQAAPVAHPGSMAPGAPGAPGAPPGASAPQPARPARPRPPSPGYRPGYNHGTYTPVVVIDPNSYLTTPNPHRTPFHNTSHVSGQPGQEVFHSLSTGK